LILPSFARAFAREPRPFLDRIFASTGSLSLRPLSAAVVPDVASLIGASAGFCGLLNAVVAPPGIR
jgi:hypothetical protein